MNKQIYLDYQATTPIDPRVRDFMIDILTNQQGNPHSRSHSYGWETEKLVEISRKQIADLIGADPKDIIFTSGATESNNLALKGAASYLKEQKGLTHIIMPITEHKCVLESGRDLERNGFKVTYLSVKKDGLIDLCTLEKVLSENLGKTAIVSVMAVHNEIGVIQPLKEIGALCKKYGSLFHTDAAQAFGKIPLNVDDMNIDLMSITAHKIYGPIGVGALYVRRKPNRVRLHPLISGGGQERGLRNGTLSPVLTAAFGKAAEIASLEMEKDALHVKKLFDRLYNATAGSIKDVFLNGSLDCRYYGNANISFAYIEGESLLMAIKDVAVSSGSACTSASLESSYVLKALGASEELAHSSLRVGFGRFSTEEEIDHFINAVSLAVTKLRELSPLWEMVQEGIDLSTIRWDAH